MRIFVDTNVFVYARDSSEAERQPIARSWLDRLWATGEGRLSTQVLSEYYVTVTRKLSPGLDPALARADIRDLTSWNPVVIEQTVIESAWTLEDQFAVSWWDALIIASAQHAGCEQLLSEDLQDGQRFGATTIVNPFTTAPE